MTTFVPNTTLTQPGVPQPASTGPTTQQGVGPAQDVWPDTSAGGGSGGGGGGGGGGTVTLAGDVVGASDANTIVNFALLKATTLEEFNPLAGTGSTIIDQTAFASALAACLTGTYGEIELGAKTYNVTGNFNVPAGVKITGKGNLSIVHQTVDDNVFIPRGEETWFDNFVITGTGAGTNQIGIANAPIGSGAHTGFSRMRATSMTFKNLATAAILTFQLPIQPPFIGPYVGDIRIENCGIGLWFLGEYSTCIGMQIEACGVGVEIEGGNQVFIGGTITNCSIAGVQLDGGGNDGHGVFVGVEINHNSGVQTIKTTGALVNGERFVDCMMFGGPINLTNTHSVIFDGCEIDVSAYNFSGSTGTVFNNPILPNAAFANVINNNVGGLASSTQWINPQDLNGAVPAWVTAAQDGSANAMRIPIATKRGTAASGGGTFVITLVPGTDLPSNGAMRVCATALMIGGAPVTDVAGLPTQAIVKLSAGVASLPTNVTGSANPSAVGTQNASASTAGFVGGSPPTAVFSIAGGNLVLTVTNQGAANATVQVAFDADLLFA